VFKELEAKNQALTAAHAQVTEALEQQTATSEILGLIARFAPVPLHVLARQSFEADHLGVPTNPQRRHWRSWSRC
jgi:hypothetical protein